VKHLRKTSRDLPATAISTDESFLNWCIWKCMPGCGSIFSRQCWNCMWSCLLHLPFQIGIGIG